MAVTMASADTILDRLGTQLPDLRGLYIDIPAAVPPRYDPALLATFLVGLDLAGTFILALSGAMAAIKHGLDLFGVLLRRTRQATPGVSLATSSSAPCRRPRSATGARPERGSARPEDASSDAR